MSWEAGTNSEIFSRNIHWVISSWISYIFSILELSSQTCIYFSILAVARIHWTSYFEQSVYSKAVKENEHEKREIFYQNLLIFLDRIAGLSLLDSMMYSAFVLAVGRRWQTARWNMRLRVTCGIYLEPTSPLLSSLPAPRHHTRQQQGAF